MQEQMDVQFENNAVTAHRMCNGGIVTTTTTITSFRLCLTNFFIRAIPGRAGSSKRQCSEITEEGFHTPDTPLPNQQCQMQRLKPVTENHFMNLILS